MRRLFAMVAAGAAVLMAAPAGAHIQVTPTEVAPADPALFTVIIPGETSSGTSEVRLEVPPGVYPFSYEETVGWDRRLIKKPNGTVDQIVWTGKARPDGLVRFSFLAGTPEKPGTIEWAAIQTYADGEEARWIGPPKSEHPAPTTSITESASRQNAGGESASSGQADPISSDGTSSDGTDWPLTIAALLGFFFGLSSLVILVLNHRDRRS